MRRDGLPALLRLAASAGSRRTVELYLRKGQDINATDRRGRTLLLIAAEKGHADLCRMLLDSGASPSLCDSEGSDALSVAIRSGQDEVEALLRASISAERTESSTAEYGVTDDDDLALADWEQEAESPPPPDDPVVRQEARELQNRIITHAAIDTDADWSDVDIELPDGTERYQAERAAWFDEVRRLMLVGLSWGFVTEDRVANLARQLWYDKPAEDEIEACLRTAFGDLGCFVTVAPDALESLLDGGPCSVLEEDSQQETVDEAITYLAGLLSPHSDPVVCYYEDVKRMEAPKVRALRRSRALGELAPRVQ